MKEYEKPHLPAARQGGHKVVTAEVTEFAEMRKKNSVFLKNKD